MCKCKGKDKKPANKQWKEKMQSAYEGGIKQISTIDMESKAQESKQTSEKTNKREDKQKVVSMRDKCRFGSNVHNFIVLKHGRHTNKQDSCMDM